MTRRLTYPEAAVELRVEESWLRRHIKRLPHAKKGRVVTFSEADLERIDAMHHHEPRDGRLVQVQPGLHPLADLKPLPARGARARAAN